ncbi:MAG: hypothetical protein JWO04_960 [Gammaproteobacteria bacterium]|nr:hypothetical protein [Gammaproteobacteria bacterium]
MDTSSDIRQRWLDEERSLRRRTAEVGVISPDQLKSFGGLEFWGQALQGTCRRRQLRGHWGSSPSR